jgi:hypothetical protein
LHLYVKTTPFEAMLNKNCLYCGLQKNKFKTQLSKTGLPSSEMSLCGRSLPYASCSESREPHRNDPIKGEGGRGFTNGVDNSNCQEEQSE